MNDLERFLRDRNADADTWIDDEGLHVHDWETDRCLVFDANNEQIQGRLRIRSIVSKTRNLQNNPNNY